MEYVEMKDGVAEMDVEIFIIPNDFIEIGNFGGYADQRYLKMATEILANLEMKAKSTELMAQVWICSEKLGIENMSGHGCTIKVDENDVFIKPRINFVPARIFEGKKEGDIVDIKFSDKGGTFKPGYEENPNFEYTLLLHARLAQNGHAYSRFGEFHEAFRKLMSTAQYRKATAATACEAMSMEV